MYVKYIYFLYFKVLFSLFMFINGEGPDILGVFCYVTSEFTCMLSVTTLPNTQTIFSVHHLCTLVYTSRDTTVTAPFLLPTLPLKKVKEKTKLSLENFNLFFFFFFFLEQGDQQNPAPAGQVDYTKAWEEYYKKMGMFYISFFIHLITLKHLVNITLEG